MQSKYFQKGIARCYELVLMYEMKQLKKYKTKYLHSSYMKMRNDDISVDNILLFTEGFQSCFNQLNRLNNNAI